MSPVGVRCINPLSPHEEENTTMSLKFALNQSMIMQCQTEEFIPVCAKAGIHAVELRIPKLKETLYHMSHQEFADLLKQHDMSVLSLNAIDDFSMVPEENLDLLKLECETVGRMCNLVDCTMVVAPVARWFGSSPPSREEVKTISQERLTYVAEIFDRFGVQVGFEPISFPEFTVKDLKLSQEILDGSGAQNVGFVPDIYNLFRGGIEPEDLTNLNYPIYLLHINDAEDRPFDELHVMYNRVFPGEGVANANAWVQALLNAGYDGYFSLELFRQEIWDMRPEYAASFCAHKLQIFADSVEKVS
ncbi:TIM barrel protein [candidate division KSB3 bacterium]|uniref:TIM barrel protein n=1 Tax=candidate division KSB3 bacterium TaxID=2044937 RepID=A0A9D5Q7N1_9BACT|nr:TIM barrel protein [candidate division KSB3 bacterium]MBD3326472.1 TIM barrel protein [candidate division KSB3 bacterium]